MTALDTTIRAHLTQDPVMAGLLDRLGELPQLSPKSPDFYFTALCQSIVSQQLSTRVADVITDRVMAYFQSDKLEPAKILQATPEELRALGLSWAKAKYMQDLAQKTVDQEISWLSFQDISEAEIMAELTKVKGIGQWTVEMFMMFTLGRPDIFSAGDLGLRRALERWYDLPDKAKPPELAQLAERWQPYRTYASLVLWRSGDMLKP